MSNQQDDDFMDQISINGDHFHSSIDMEELLSNINRNQKVNLLQLLGEVHERHKYNRLTQLFPDEGELSRDKYAKHVEFMNKGAEYSERCFMAGNRVGKSLLGGCETAYHATGLYPSWWEGKRFTQPTSIVVAGNTNETSRDIIQTILLGPIHDMGSGLLPRERLLDKKGRFTVTTRSGVPGAKQDIYIRHVSGGLSQITIKSFEQRREGFEGTSRHFTWLDEECPLDIYTECLTRCMTTKGIVMITFTPLKGLSDTVMQFIPNGQFPDTPTRCGPVRKAREIMNDG